jgi:gonadotropin-releasing hormone receptor
MHSDLIVTTPAAQSTPMTENVDPSMRFNDGHRMAIVTYSVLMVVSAVGNLTVLITILRRRRALRYGNNHMFMHLAIADLLVSTAESTAFRKLTV